MCPSTVAGGAVTIGTTTVTPAGAGVSPAAPAAVPGVSGEQQRLVESRSRRRHSRSSSYGTDRRAKKSARRRSPSPGLSSRRRGGTIALLWIRLKKIELMPLLPDLGVRMEVRLAVLDLLRRMIVRRVLGCHDHMPGMTGTGQVLVVDPRRLRALRMTTGLVLLSW